MLKSDTGARFRTVPVSETDNKATIFTFNNMIINLM